jgi:hypothetical protein
MHRQLPRSGLHTMRCSSINVPSTCALCRQIYGMIILCDTLAPQFSSLLAVLKPNRIIRKRTDANYSSFYLRVFLGLSNLRDRGRLAPISIPHDNFGERKAKFNLETSRATQMQLYKCIHVP